MNLKKHEDYDEFQALTARMCQTPNVRWQFSNQGWHLCKQAAWMNTYFKFQVTFSSYYQREGFPPLQRHWYTALCTWHVLGELRCHLLLCHVAAIMGFWETPHGTPPFRGTSLFWRSICCVVAKICWHRVTFIPNFCWLYSKMHNKTLKISFKLL